MAITDNNPDLPNYKRPELVAVCEDLDLVHDLLAGTRKMHDRSKSYVRKWTDEDLAVYDIRRKCETVFEGLGRTLSAAVGMLFAKPPHIEWNDSEAAMTAHWENIDAAGTKGTVFAKRFSEASIRDGIGAILVDHTPAPEGVVITAANEQALGLRPTWAMYARSQILSWRTAVINNARTLTQVVLHESADVESKGYGIGSVNRFRVLYLQNGVAFWRLLEQKDEDGNKPDSFVEIASGIFTNKDGQAADFIPLSIAYTGRTDAPLTSTIPLLGVAWANLAHWLASTDLRFYRSLCAYPQPVVIGHLAPDPQTGQPTALKVGPMVAVHLSNDNGNNSTFEWAELNGTSLDQLVQGVEEKLKQMAQMGMSFLQTDTRAAETAAAKRLDAVAENSTLATAAQGLSDCLNSALQHHAWYLSIPPESAPVLTINQDFEATTMQADILTAWVGAISNAGLPPRLLLEAMQGGGLIKPDEDLDALEAEMQVNAQAAADAKAAELAAQMANAGQDGAPPKQLAA